jgi:hypothetical protein
MRLALLAALCCWALPAQASDLPAPQEMQRVGAATLRWFGLRVYDAELRAPARPVTFSSPFALSLRYARALKGRAIAERSLKEITTLGFGSPAQRASWTAAMQALFPDVAEGDRLTGEHLPGRGARFFHNGRLLGEIDDPQFSHAFFSIWLDPRTREPALRAELLGGQ